MLYLFPAERGSDLCAMAAGACGSAWQRVFFLELPGSSGRRRREGEKGVLHSKLKMSNNCY